MADANFTAATPEELAEQFPITNRPFAVWYNDDSNCDSRKWVVNNEDGCAIKEFKNMATALRTAAKMGKKWDIEARKQALALTRVSRSDRPNLSGFVDEYRIPGHFYDLRALAMAVSVMTFSASESPECESDDICNAMRRVLGMLADKALEFANEADELALEKAMAKS